MSRISDKPSSDARRTAIRSALTAAGMDPNVAERWCGAWEAEAALRRIAPGDDYWDAGKQWIDSQCSARKLPPN